MTTLLVWVNKETANSTLHEQRVLITMPQPGSPVVCQTSQGSLQNGLSPFQKNGLTNDPTHDQTIKAYVDMNNKM